MSEQAAVTHTGIRGAVRRLYNWVLHWADSPYGLLALFIIAFAEASFFPIPPDVLLIALVLGKPKSWAKFAATCLIGSLMGAMAGYYIGWGFWAVLSEYFFSYIPGFTPHKFELAAKGFNDNAFLFVFGAAFSPIPFKAITISAGVAKASIPILLGASLLGRGARFFLVAGLIGRHGEPMKVFIDKYFELLALAFVVLLIGGFAVMKVLL